MAYDQRLARRLKEVYQPHKGVVEKKMFGGLAFMVNGHMSCGVSGDELMVRVGPEQYAKALGRQHAREMDFTGRSLTGFVYVASEGVKTKRQLSQWVNMSLKFVRSLPPK